MIRFSLYLLLTFNLFVWSCAEPSGRSEGAYISLLNGAQFEVLDGEKITGNTASRAEQFDQLKPKGKFQIPLYNSVKGNSYDIFIGLPVMITLDGFLSRELPQGARLMQDKQEKNSFHYRLYQANQDSSYIAELAFSGAQESEIPGQKKDLYYILAKSKDKENTLRILNVSNLLKRFGKKAKQ